MFVVIDPTNADDPDHEPGEFRVLLMELDLGVEQHEYIHFLDEDGERAFFRAGDVSLFEISHDLLLGFLDDDSEE